jgi:hypothetical protein
MCELEGYSNQWNEFPALRQRRYQQLEREREWRPQVCSTARATSGPAIDISAGSCQVKLLRSKPWPATWLGPIRDHLEEKLRADIGQGHLSYFVQKCSAEHFWTSLVMMLKMFLDMFRL